jgi:hypothetical protein
MNIELTKEQKAYFSELAVQIVATHGEHAAEMLAADPVAAVQAAHQARREFIVEMLDQRTDRSRMAKIALCAGVYAEANRVAAFDTAVEQCGHIADHSFRKSIGFA